MLSFLKRNKAPKTIAEFAGQHPELLRYIDLYLDNVKSKSLAVDAGEPSFWLSDPWQMSSKNYAKSYATILWVHIAIRVLAMSASKLPLRMYASKGNEAVEVTTGLAYELFRKPALFTTPNEIKLSMFSSLLYSGNSYLFFNPDQPELWSLLPQHVKINSDRIDFIKSYTFKPNETSEEFKILPEHMVHTKFFNSEDYRYGLSPLTAAWASVNSLKYDAAYWTNFWKHGGRTQGSWSTDNHISEEQIKRFHERIKTLYKGMQNMFRDIVLTNGMKYTQIGVSQKDAELIEKYKLSRDDVLAAFHVPSSMAGVMDQANFSNMEVQERVFWEIGVVPMLTLFEEALGANEILSEGGRIRFKFDTSEVRALQFIDTKRAEFGKLLIESKQWTPNEVREELWKKGPIDGGDALQSREQIPLQLSSKPEETKALPPAQIKSTSEDEKKKIAKAFDDLLKRHDNDFVKIFRARFKQQKSQALEKLRQILKDRGSVTLDGSDLDEIVASIRPGYQTMDDKLKPAIEEVYQIFGEREAKKLNSGSKSIRQKDATFNFRDPAVSNFIINRSTHIANVTDEFTLEFFRQGLALQFEEDGSIEATSKFVSDFFEGMEKWRANRIARTETAAAANSAIFETWSQNKDMVKGKEWINANDSFVRDTHKNVAPVDSWNADFVLSDGDRGPFPLSDEFDDLGNVINCRCTAIAIT